ncbi:hypothetical protein [Psychrobacter sp. 16-MNA-CIBAN-0192]|uniref:hypothetical protein n=1 Tax=Psychrobacter sp. 16-MNA-CIBAN-0192 TaxID=3140448 RepID=UPI003323D4B4
MSQSEHDLLTLPTLSITNFNLPSLHLLHDEIISTLRDTESYLNEFTNDQQQSALLLDSIEVLTQLSRIFELISLMGGQVLTTAIVQSLQQLHDSGDNTNTALIMDLSEAIMTLDRYIEFVLLTETIEPSLLLPIINKLHVHAHLAPLAADYFFDFGNSSVIVANPEQNFQPLRAMDLDDKRLSHAFRSGFSVVLTNNDGQLSNAERQKLVAMSSACNFIAAHNNCLFWQAAAAAMTDIESILPLNNSQKHTLIYLEQQFHSYLPINDSRFAELVSLACQRNHIQGQQLRSQYAINQLETPQREQMRRFLLGPNRQVIDTLHQLIQAQINHIKEKVDNYSRGHSLTAIDLQVNQITKELIEMSSTLRLLRLNTAASALYEAGNAVIKWQSPSPSDFDHLLQALMSAENAMITMAKLHTPGIVKLPLNNEGISLHQLDTAYNTLIQESRTTIASAEQALNDYVADNDHDVLHIRNLPEMLHQVSGATRFLQMPISSSMLSQLTRYLERRLDIDYPLDNHSLEHIADVLMSVDYYLQSYENHRPISRQSLNIAQNSLTQLLAA